MSTAEPQSPEQWQEAADAAYAAMALDSARQYGLVTDGPEVDLERCESLLRRARARGIFPRPEGIEQFVHELLTGQKGKTA